MKTLNKLSVQNRGILVLILGLLNFYLIFKYPNNILVYISTSVFLILSLVNIITTNFSKKKKILTFSISITLTILVILISSFNNH